MLQPHLKSRVSRRLFTRFLLAALLPIGGLAWYAYQNVGHILIENAHHRLTLDSKSYGMSLVESLNRRADSLQLAIKEANGFAPAAANGFSQIAYGEAIPTGASASDGLRLWLSAGQAPELVAALPGDRGTVVGKIAEDGFWNNDSAPERFCVFNSSKETLHCSAELSTINGSAIPATSRDQNSTVSEHQLGGTDYLFGFWQARYLPSLNSPGFIVMVATPKELALEDLARFRIAFPAVLLLAMALAAGLSISQIRQQMEPLVRLEESTRRLSAGDLRARVNIEGNDEFGQLGRAFDQMAGHLEHKFYMLGLLSELDRAILGSSERDAIVEILLRSIHQALPCDIAGLMLFNEAGNGSLVSRLCSGTDAGVSAPTDLSARNLPDFPEGQAWCELQVDDLPAACRQAFSQPKIAQLLAFPSHLNSRLDSLVLLAFAEPTDSLDEIVQAGRSLADRLSIAASSIAREQMLYQQAHYDALTKLPNRVLLRDRIEQAIARADRAETSAALLFIDLDGFKQVNDSLGHSTGDHLLIECASRLSQRMRKGDTVARLGGDEFVVLIPDLSPDVAYATVDGMARDLNEILAAPFQLTEQHIVSPASIGIALYPDNAANQEDLVKMADAAMYESKRRNAGGYCFYTSNISALTRDRFELTQELRDAVQQNQLLLYYQPKVDARSGRLAGAEALLRWRSPKRGMVLPGVFVNLLDEMGLSIWLGEWVLDQACAQMHAWDLQGFPPFPVSINFSPIQFDRTPVFDRVQDALAKYTLEPSRLEMEILESMAAGESQNAHLNLIRLRALGVSIALDDFGTGYSSLVNLTQVPADIVKLDRVFIHSVCTDPRQRQIVELIISMVKVMNLRVVAEGVEKEEQRQLLPTLGCDVLQGYLVGHPVSPEAFAERWLEATPSL